ncbi:MAG: hypothetical protein H7222_17090 [Methylotenera sp.]|nr:hypothetical protein [Oligoflexia bacterium]
MTLFFAGCGGSAPPQSRAPVLHDQATSNMDSPTFAGDAADGFLPNSELPTPLVRRNLKADFLIYDGKGVDSTDTSAIVKLIRAHGLTERTISESALNSLTAAEFAQYGTFIWPGGDNEEMDTVISASARRELRKAVIQKGLNYVGICAGAFIAVGPSAGVEETPVAGLALLNGTFIDNYRPASGNPISMVWTDFPDGSRRDLILWWGPYFETQTGVVARYSADGRPAMIQGRVGHSFVVLSGPHPEAPQSWRKAGGLEDEDGLDTDIAWRLIQAAHTHHPLPTF